MPKVEVILSEMEGGYMNRVKLEIEIATSDKSKIQAETISNYVLRAIAGVCGTNRAVVTSYKCTIQGLEALDNREKMEG